MLLCLMRMSNDLTLTTLFERSDVQNALRAAVDERIKAYLEERPKIGVVFLPHYAGATRPAYKTEGSSGFDLVWSPSGLPRNKLGPRERRLFTTGIKVELPPGYELQVRSRSGLTLYQGVTVANGVGTIDSDYRGEIVVVLVNIGHVDVELKPGERIAQAVITRVVQGEFEEREVLSDSSRGTDGFGSTGRY